MQHDRKIDRCPFRGPLYVKKKAPREQLLQNNHKHGSRPKDLNKNTDTSKNTYPPQAKIDIPRPKENSVHFEYSYDSINPIQHP